MPRPPKPLHQVLLALFKSTDDLYTFLSTYSYQRMEDLLNSLPGTNVARSTYVLKAVEQMQAHGLDDRRLFATLTDRFPTQHDRIEAARREYFGETAPSADLAGEDGLVNLSLSLEPAADLAEQQEKVTGDRPTFLDVSYLATGYERSKSVAKLRMRFGGRWYAGTAFLVKPDTLLTAHHNLWMKGTRAEAVEVIFDYERATQQPQAEGSLHLPNLDSFFGDEALDWAALKLIAPQTGRPLAPLSPKSVSKRDRVSIIQHPHGLPKQVALHHNLVTYVGDQTIQYLTDTEPGSSGSPVFDADWNVVAIHHSGGHLPVPGKGGTVFCNQGVPIQQVRSGLALKGITF